MFCILSWRRSYHGGERKGCVMVKEAEHLISPRWIGSDLKWPISGISSLARPERQLAGSLWPFADKVVHLWPQHSDLTTLERDDGVAWWCAGVWDSFSMSLSHQIMSRYRIQPTGFQWPCLPFRMKTGRLIIARIRTSMLKKSWNLSLSRAFNLRVMQATCNGICDWLIVTLSLSSMLFCFVISFIRVKTGSLLVRLALPIWFKFILIITCKIDP